MPDDTITLTSSTDTPEDVQAALTGQPAEKPVEKAPEVKAEEKPAGETPPADADKAAADKAAADKAVADKAAADAAAAAETPEQKAEREEAARATARDKRKNKIQKEIDDLTAKKYDARRDADAEEARLATLRAQRAALEAEGKTAAEEKKTPATAAATDPHAPEPTLEEKNADGTDKYKNYEEFQSAHGRWTVAESKAQAAAEATRIAKEAADKADQLTKAERERIDRDAAARADQDILAKHDERLEEFRNTHDDFDALMEDVKDLVSEVKGELGDRAFSAIDRYIAFDAENGPDVLYHLLKNHDEMRAIAAKPGHLQLVALAKLDERLGAANRKPAQPTLATPVTKAPDPIKPVGTTPTASSVSPEDEDYRSYAARRNKEERERQTAYR